MGACVHPLEAVIVSLTFDAGISVSMCFICLFSMFY